MSSPSCRFFYTLILLVSLDFLFVSCTEQGPAEKLTLVTWNVQNLSDDVHQGTEYAEFDPARGIWNRRLYEARIHQLASAMAAMVPHQPAIVVLCEVENKAVVTELCEHPQFPKGWQGIFWQGPPGGGMGFAVLTGIPVLKARSHGFSYPPYRLRPLLELVVKTDRGPLQIFAGHWKSRLEGLEKTTPARLLASDAVLRMSFAGPSLLMGDLNEEAGIGALGASATFNKMPAHYQAMEDVLASIELNTESLLTEEGTYWFRGRWEQIDHIRRSGVWPPSVLELQTPKIPGLRNGQNQPWRYDSRTGRGSSDHLPLIMDVHFTD